MTFNLRKFLTENKLTSNSKKLNESPIGLNLTTHNKAEHIKWVGEDSALVNFAGNELLITFFDSEEADDGAYFLTYRSEELPDFDFITLGAYMGPHQGYDPAYYGEEWEVDYVPRKF